MPVASIEHPIDGGKRGYDLRLVERLGDPWVAADRRAKRRDVYAVAVGMIPFGKYPDEGIEDLTGMAIKNLLDQGPVARHLIQAARMSDAGCGMSAGQHCIRGQVTRTPLGIGEVQTAVAAHILVGRSSPGSTGS